jgi:protease-4
MLAAAAGIMLGGVILGGGVMGSVRAEEPATAPATAPATVPAVQPATTRAAQPTPAELIKQLRERQKKEATKPQVAHIDLTTGLGERDADFDLLGGGGGGGLTLRDLLNRLDKARDTKEVRAVLITLGAGAGMSLSQAQEVRDHLKEFGKSGKRVFVYADTYESATYTLASGASDICLMQGGEVFIPGPAVETQFFRGIMDKVGVKADYIQIGEYKGADESYTRTEASEELRGELNRLVESLYNQTIDSISEARNIPTAVVKQMVDEAMISAPAARDRKLIDHVVDMDGLRGLIEGELNAEELRFVADFGAADRPKIDFANLLGSLAMLSKPQAPPTKPVVAVVVADGVIVDGEGGGGGGLPLIGGGAEVGSDRMRRAFGEALRDDNVKAVVLRIDSPGGSALASEAMWQSARRLAAEKPLVISIGSMAASGGYYLASAGDYIFADSTAIVGSIGVVGGKFVLGGMFEKLGVGSESFSRGKNANLFSSATPWNEDQRRMVQRWMKRTYDQFTERVMTTRTGKIKDIDKVARGRIFLARDALALGMVDELGGLRKAIAHAGKQAELNTPDEFEVRIYPQPKTLADMFTPTGRTVMTPLHEALGRSAILAALPEAVRRPMVQQLQIMQLLEKRPVMVAMPFSISIK